MFRNLITAARVSSPLNVCVGSCKSSITAATSYLVMQVCDLTHTLRWHIRAMLRLCLCACKSQAWGVCHSWVSVDM